MTNVGSGIATHRAKVTQPKGSVVILSPERLTFRYKNIINFIFELIYYLLENNNVHNISFGLWNDIT